MKIKLSKSEIAYITKADFFSQKIKHFFMNYYTEKNEYLPIDIPEEIEMELYETLQKNLPLIGFDKNYELTKEGSIIENLMDKLGE